MKDVLNCLVPEPVTRTAVCM